VRVVEWHCVLRRFLHKGVDFEGSGAVCGNIGVEPCMESMEMLSVAVRCVGVCVELWMDPG
jgi:hypothetical protein